MTSTLYRGEVMHRRTRPKAYKFVYRVFNLYLDIDRIGETAAGLRWLSHNRLNLLSFHDRDHGPRDGSSLRPWIDRVLADAGLSAAGAHVYLLCMPRVLGYGFDPLSIWYCHDKAGVLRAVLYEVKNTFGDQHGYLFPVEDGDAPTDHRAQKLMHVSPLIGMDARYRLRLARPDQNLSVLIRESDPDGEFLVATLTGTRRSLSDAELLRAFFSVPVLGVKVIAAIHWQAIRLMLRGVRFHRRPPPPDAEVSLPTARRDAAQ